MNPILWQPSQEQITHSAMTEFQDSIKQRHTIDIDNYPQLHAWSVKNPNDFWQAVWDSCGIQASKPSTQAFIPGDSISTGQWFPKARLNFAANLLSRCDDSPAIIYTDETQHQHTLSYRQLHHEVARISAYLREQGVSIKDRVAAILPNGPEAIIAMLATTSIGAIWSSCSPDFGLASLLDRFEQIQPSIVFASTEHHYNGKSYPHQKTLEQLQQKIPSIKKMILVGSQAKNFLNHSLAMKDIPPTTNTIQFEQLPFDHPAFIVFSSGTTGKPKCIVHSAGGTLLQHLKELKLHSNLSASDRLFFYSTCGWMMWNWMVSALALGSTVVLYDGCPTYPSADHLFQLIDRCNITAFGVGAKLIELAEHRNLDPKRTLDLSSLKTLLSTGSPLNPASFDYIYKHIKKDIQVSSISGGTDIISCFALGNPNLPVYRGELQCLGLGMAVKVFNENGDPIINTPGELVCCNAFPSMPLGFWGDDNGSRYYQAYFARFDNTWAHGDYAIINDHEGITILGRSDTTLNPGGIRIGTAEIYQQVNSLTFISDSLAVGYNKNQDEKIILFVVLKDAMALDEKHINTIKTRIRQGTTAHHVPYKIIAVKDLPKTLSGKLAEIAVKQTLQQVPVKNKDALANPESLQLFENLNL